MPRAVSVRDIVARAQRIRRRITIVVNGKPVIGDQTIPAFIGSAIDVDEAAPGPIMLPGEETRVEIRSITISVPSRDTRQNER